MPTERENLNSAIDADITSRTSSNKITPTVDGASRKKIADYADAQDAKKADKVSPEFTGDPKAPTPATNDNDTSVATTAFVKLKIDQAKPYKEIVLLLDQPNPGETNTTVLQNDFAGVTVNPVGSPGTGLYLITTSANVFTAGKTTIQLGPGTYTDDVTYKAQRQSANQLCVFQFYSGSASSGNFMDDLTVTVRVYP